MIKQSSVYYAINLAISSTRRTQNIIRMSTTPSSFTPKSSVNVAERGFDCSDGVKLASRYWTNFNVAGEGHSRLPPFLFSLHCISTYLMLSFFFLIVRQKPICKYEKDSMCARLARQCSILQSIGPSSTGIDVNANGIGSSRFSWAWFVRT
jgi:hypothetical protein